MMSSLRNIQRNFISDCLSGELENDNISMSSDLLVDRISAKGRIGIYRESAIGNITIALQMTYPVVEDLVGVEFFEGMSRKYTQKYFPKSGDMNDYGAEMANFIEGFEPAKSLSYLPDIARLEWLFHLSSLADDRQASDWSGLAELCEEELAKLVIIMHPSVQIMSSKHPVLKIWAMSRENGEGFDISKYGGDNVLLVRKDLKVNLYPLADNELAFLLALIDGETLLEAMDRAINIDEAGASDFIAKHIDIGSFCLYIA